jgi:hypothetical protein
MVQSHLAGRRSAIILDNRAVSRRGEGQGKWRDRESDGLGPRSRDGRLIARCGVAAGRCPLHCTALHCIAYIACNDCNAATRVRRRRAWVCRGGIAWVPACRGLGGPDGPAATSLLRSPSRLPPGNRPASACGFCAGCCANRSHPIGVVTAFATILNQARKRSTGRYNAKQAPSGE